MSAAEQAVKLVAEVAREHRRNDVIEGLMEHGTLRVRVRCDSEACDYFAEHEWVQGEPHPWFAACAAHAEHVAAEIVKALGLTEEFAACQDDPIPRMDGVRRQRFVQPTLDRARGALEVVILRSGGVSRNPAIETRLVTPWREVTP